MAAPQPSTRQRAIALAALLSDDHELGPLAAMAEELAAPARTLAEPWVSATADERGAHVTAEREALLGGPEGAGGDTRPAGLCRLVASLEETALPSAEVPVGLRTLVGAPLGLLAGLTAALLQRGARGEGYAATLLGHAGAAAEASPRLAPAIVWSAFALARAEGEVEALAATWPQPLARTLLTVHDTLGHTATDEEAAQERARLELELTGLG